MSDRELRQILRDVMEDIDAGRLARVGRALGRTAVVASLAVGSAISCAAAPPRQRDAQVGSEASIVDVGPYAEYGAPFEASVDDASTMHDTGVTADASPSSDASNL